MEAGMMAGATDLEQDVRRYLHRIRQIDAILKEPVKTLLGAPVVRTAENGAPQTLFPTWLIEDEPPSAGFDKETQSLCCQTVQRLRRVRRRLTWLNGDNDIRQMKALGRSLIDSFVPQWVGGSEDNHEDSYRRCLLA